MDLCLSPAIEIGGGAFQLFPTIIGPRVPDEFLVSNEFELRMN